MSWADDPSLVGSAQLLRSAIHGIETASIALRELQRRVASGTEAGTGATTGSARKGDGPTRQGDAQ